MKFFDLRNYRWKLYVYPILFVVGCMLFLTSSAGWGAGFLGWHVILAGVLVFPFIYDLGKAAT